MMQNDQLSLKLSIQRRLNHLMPQIEPVLKLVGPLPSANTKRQYAAAVERMRDRKLVPEKIGAASRRSYNLYRAAIVHFAQERIRENHQKVSQHGHTMGSKLAHEKLNIIELQLEILRRYPPRDRETPSLWRRPSAGPTKRGKRRGLGRLPIRWREAVLKACPESSVYYCALLVLALTGARPAELALGVRVDADGDGVKVTIKGAKVTETSGQPSRELWFSADSWMVRSLLARAVASGTNGLTITINDPRAFSDYVRGLSARLFRGVKYVVSPYSFRHAFAADRKAEQVPIDLLAWMLGHLSGRSQRAYGATRQGGHATLAKVVAVNAVREVKRLELMPWINRPHLHEFDFAPAPA